MTDPIPHLPAQSEITSVVTLGAILEQSQDCIKIIATDGSLDFMNTNGQKVMEVEDFATVAGNKWWDYWPAESIELVRNAVKDANAGKASNFEAACPTLTGTLRWWDVSVAPLKNATGTVGAILAVSRDITQRVLTREANKAVASEMRHRVRNAFALSASLARALARGDDAVEQFSEDLGMRLSYLGEAQNLLLDTLSEGIALNDLVTRLASVYQGHDDMILVDQLPATALDERQAQGLALAIGELSTNSHKYGGLKYGRPVQISAEEEGHEIIVHWHEKAQRHDGELLIATPTRGNSNGGQGKELMRRFMAAIGGSIVHEWSNDALHVTIRFPLENGKPIVPIMPVSMTAQ